MPTTEITIRDGTAYLGIDDPELKELIVDATSFKLEGAQYQARRHGDKRTKLVRNNKCPVGLLDRVCRTISTYGTQPTISYADTETADKPRLKLRLFDIEPRDYQVEAELAASVYERGIIRAPTGSGKTLICAQIIVARGMHSLVIVPTIDLLYQTKVFLGSCLWPDHVIVDPRWHIGQLGDGVVDPQPVTVATIRTIAKVLDVAYESYEYAEYDDKDDTEVNRQELKSWLGSIGVVVVDEAHQLGARTLYDTVTRIPAPCKYGMSASPWRDDGADLMIEAATGPPIFHVPAARLVHQGYLMAPAIRVIDTSQWWQSAAWGSVCAKCGQQWLRWTKECKCGCSSFRSQFPDSYRVEIVENPIRNAMITQIVRDLDRTTLILVKQIKHGRKLLEMLGTWPEVRTGAVFLSGKDKGTVRKDALDAMRAGQLNTIICSTIGDMGLDIPNLSALVLAGGGKSSTRHLQRIGRAVRPYEGKPTPEIVDFDDSHIHSWYANHVRARRRIEVAEWDGLATWSFE